MSMKKLTLFFLCLFAGIGWAMAQNRTVTGTVTSSEDKLPIIGVNIVVVGQTTIGTATNIDGQFTLSVPAYAKQLRFTSIGMKEVILDIKPQMNVVMSPDNEMLDAVVVVGYGSGQKLGTVTGSVARVSSEKLENRPVANVMDALQGQVSGMEVRTSSGDPNAVASITIHGNASLGASSAPLYIVDGVQTSPGVVMAMNQNDIESYTVLRDASSTSIYGARAANGVIVITTKKGKRNHDGVINASVMYGVSQLISDRPFHQLMTGQELIDYELRHQSPKGRAAFLKGFEPTNFDGILNPAEGTATVAHDHNWLKAYMGNYAPTLQADMSIMGGGENISYYVSGGYFSQEGISATKSHYDKLNIRTNFDARVKEWLRVGVNMNGGLVRQLAASGFGSPYVDAGTFGALAMPRYYSPFKRNADGSFGTEYADVIRIHRSFPVLKGRLFMPQYKNKFEFEKNNSFRLNTSGYAQITPIEGLTLKTQLGVDYVVGNNTARFLPTHPDANGLGSARRSASFNYGLTWTNTAEYKWKADDVNDFTFLLGHEFVDSHSEGFAAAGRGMLSPEFMFIQMGQRGDYLIQPSESESDYAYLSFFGRVNYNFKNWVSADVTLRHDRSSRFGANHQGATFFSLGALYDFKNALLADNDLFSSLRLKANYGTQGNSSISLYAADPLTGTIYYTNKIAFGVTSIGNPDLSWEKQGMFSVGADMGMFQDRLTASLSYYHRNTTNMLMDVPLPYSTGYSARWQNVGAMTNQGIDFDFQYNFVKTKDWDAFFRTSFGYNFERVDKLFSEQTNKNGYIMPGIDMIYRVGKPTTYIVPVFAGFDPSTGKQMWYKPGTNEKTADYSEDLRQPIEYARVSPPFNGGFSMGVTWKQQLSLVLDWSFSVGGYTMNNDRFFFENNVPGFSMLNRSKKLLKEWTPTNTEDVQASVYDEAMKFDTRLLENNSFLRLKNITLSYTFPKSLFEGVPVISGAKVYVSGRNLITVVHPSFNGFDPETTSQGGFTMNTYPATSQYVGGVQLTF